MYAVDFPLISSEQVETNKRRFNEMVSRFQSDAAFRRQLETDGAGILAEYGFQIPPGAVVKVVADSPGVQHIVMPPDPNTDLSEEMLEQVAGGSTLSSAGTAGTMSTALSSTMVSTAGTAGCASTAASG